MIARQYSLMQRSGSSSEGSNFGPASLGSLTEQPSGLDSSYWVPSSHRRLRTLDNSMRRPNCHVPVEDTTPAIPAAGK